MSVRHFVLCTSFSGKRALVEKRKQRPRRAAYAFIVHDGRMLVVTCRQTDPDKFFFPGGQIDPGESPEDAVVREALEETGLVIAVKRRFAVVEHDGFYSLTMQGWRCISSLFICEARTSDLGAWNPATADEGEVPLWAPLASLLPASFQNVGEQFFMLWLEESARYALP